MGYDHGCAGAGCKRELTLDGGVWNDERSPGKRNMTARERFLAQFRGDGERGPVYVPDLTLWYDWHAEQATLPPQWRGFTLPEIARAMGVPIWLRVFPGRVGTSGVDVTVTEERGERVIRFQTSTTTLVSRWTLGPDGDWWQTEYPVKRREDLPAVLEIASARSYVFDGRPVADAREAVGDDGVVALELPRRPYSDLLHEFLGWSEGLLYLREPIINEIVAILEQKLQTFAEQVAQLPGEIVFSPDNLDGQFISPKAFERYLAPSYEQTAAVMRAGEKRLVVHVGGPIRHLVAPMAQAGVDGFEGIAGVPQSDLTLADARQSAGPGVTLWGGIPQDYLLEQHERERLERAVEQAVTQMRGDGRVIIGVADRVPVAAELSRLEAIPALIERFAL
jgi:hypothetical protein